MELLNIDIGIKSYQLVEGGAPLTFNAGDPNVYARYMEAMDKIKAVEKEMSGKANSIDASGENAGEESLKIMYETDRRMKAILNGIFGRPNDFEEILRGVSLMAVTANGDRVVNKVLEALSPIMQNGAKACAEIEVKEAKLNREQRRALCV